VQTIEQICEGDENVSESEEEEEDSVVPSYNEALNTLATFWAFIDNVPETILKSIREVESFSMALRRNFTKQSTLDSFFVKELFNVLDTILLLLISFTS
jgi:L-cysteine desulfidase